MNTKIIGKNRYCLSSTFLPRLTSPNLNLMEINIIFNFTMEQFVNLREDNQEVEYDWIDVIMQSEYRRAAV